MKLFQKLLLFSLGLLLFASSINAQVGNTGAPIVNVTSVNVCDDGTTLTMALQFVAGNEDPVVLGYYDQAGNEATLSGNTLTVGACDGSGSGPEDQYAFDFIQMCDDGTPFYRLVLFTNNTLPGTVTDYELDMTTPYTVSGSVAPGPCVISSVASLSRVESTTSGTIAAGTMSFKISNEGVKVAQITVGGTTSNLRPGASWGNDAMYDRVNNRYIFNPQIAYDANESLLIITTSN